MKKLKKHPDIPQNMNYNFLHATDDVDICELFSDYFQSTYSNLQSPSNCLYSVASKSLIFDNITSEKLESAFIKLKMTSSSGPDGIPSVFIKRCWPNLKEPSMRLFNKSLSSVIFPHAWKLSYTLPIHKNGSRNEVTNYRPISNLNHFPKLLYYYTNYCILASVISDFVFLNISSSRHRYLKGRSISTNLLTFITYLHDSFFNSQQTDTIYFDFGKAFDVIDHSLLQ